MSNNNNNNNNPIIGTKGIVDPGYVTTWTSTTNDSDIVYTNPFNNNGISYRPFNDFNNDSDIENFDYYNTDGFNLGISKSVINENNQDVYKIKFGNIITSIPKEEMVKLATTLLDKLKIELL
jgi:hypothetical protein